MPPPGVHRGRCLGAHPFGAAPVAAVMVGHGEVDDVGPVVRAGLEDLPRLDRAVQAGAGQRPPSRLRVGRHRLQERGNRVPALKQFRDGARAGRLGVGGQVEDAVAGDKGGDGSAVAKVGLGQRP